MRQIEFKGIFAKSLMDFINIKRSVGYKYKDIEYIFRQFDQLTEELGVKTMGITKELSNAWCRRRPNETQATQYIRIKYISSFSKYLNGIGHISYIPETPKLRYSFSAYIFTHNEIIDLFKGCDNYANNYLQKSRYWFIPILVRLLYCTGMRLQEALSIRRSDIDFKSMTITVYNTKNGDDRIIPISQSLLPYIEQLLAKNKTIHSSDKIFQYEGQYQTVKGHIGAIFKDCLELAGIEYKGKHIGPRLHDLRHTFACHSLKQMDECGMDIYTTLPILSTILGHRSMDSTEKYAKLTSEVYPEIIKKIESLQPNLFPIIHNN